jgi:plastocyanin
MRTLLTLTLLLAPWGASAEEIVISQKGKAFDRTVVDARLGDTLIFKNDEADITHNVYSLSAGNTFELKTQTPGASDRVPLDPAAHQAGTMEVECAIHPNMKLIVNIK